MGKKTVYESLITGLKEAVDDAKNENTAFKKHIVIIENKKKNRESSKGVTTYE